jgi:hypothetical protein
MSAPGQGCDGFITKVLGRACALFKWPILILGTDPNGNPQPANLDANGNILTAPGVPAASTTPTATRTDIAPTVAGSVPTGTIMVQFLVGPGASATIGTAGLPLSSGNSYLIPAGPKLHPAIPYTVTGGNLYISYES